MEENGSSVLREVDDLLRKIEQHRPSLRERLMDFVKESLDMEFTRCMLHSHALPSGQILYTATIICPECSRVHTYVVVANEDGTFALAAPAPIGKE